MGSPEKLMNDSLLDSSGSNSERKIHQFQLDPAQDISVCFLIKMENKFDFRFNKKS